MKPKTYAKKLIKSLKQYNINPKSTKNKLKLEKNMTDYIELVILILELAEK